MNGGFQPSGSIGPKGEIWFPSVRGAVHFSPNHYRSERHPPVRMESVLIDNQMVPATGDIVIGPAGAMSRLTSTACSLRAPERLAFRYNWTGRWIVDHCGQAQGRRFIITFSGQISFPGHCRERIARRQFLRGQRVPRRAAVLLPNRLVLRACARRGRSLCRGCSVPSRAAKPTSATILRLAERTRIAREMHDTVVQGCVGVSTLIEAAVGSAGSDQAQMLECLDNARIHLRLTLDEARPGAIRSTARFFRQRSRRRSIRACTIGEYRERNSGDSAGGGIGRAARGFGKSYASARDAGSRAQRRRVRSPRAINVRLVFEPSTIRLEIHDNGCGFEPAADHLAASGHFGILGMRERMEQIGGSLEIASSPGKGAMVTASPAARTYGSFLLTDPKSATYVKSKQVRSPIRG